MRIHKSSTKLLASAKAVITLFLSLPGDDRIRNVVKRVEGLGEDTVHACLDMTIENYAKRHRNLEQTFRDHFDKIKAQYGSELSHLSDQKKLLLGAFFTKEYSIQSAALFNPSVVSHPDQKQM